MVTFLIDHYDAFETLHQSAARLSLIFPDTSPVHSLSFGCVWAFDYTVFHPLAVEVSCVLFFDPASVHSLIRGQWPFRLAS